ncbi:hypothetical protein ACT8ZV_15825 [Nocardioides sp. MAHUQ-72]|uniref:hypothetical protein n=1 Tax=unclassified Nocardioides TaxID=2615069 RepID=UPI0036141004
MNRAVQPMLRVALTTALTAALLLSGSIAFAGTWRHADPSGDSKPGYSGIAGEGDIGKVTVAANRRIVRLAWRGAPGSEWASGMFWQLDTVKGNRGPEFMISWTYDISDHAYLGRIDTWTKGWAGGPGERRCRGLKVRHPDIPGPGQNYVVPLRCLKSHGAKPTKVRVNLESSDLSSTYALDVAPSHHRFGRWVRTR